MLGFRAEELYGGESIPTKSCRALICCCLKGCFSVLDLLWILLGSNRSLISNTPTSRHLSPWSGCDFEVAVERLLASATKTSPADFEKQLRVKGL